MAILPIVRPQVRAQALVYPITDGGVPVQPGYAGDLYLPWPARFSGWVIAGRSPADAPGNIVIDLRVAAPGAFPAESSIVGLGFEPKIVNGLFAKSDVLTGWSVDHDEGSNVAIYVMSASVLTVATLTILVKRA